MNLKALILAAATAATGVAVTVTLNLVAPITHAEETGPAGVTVDEVFGASVDEPGASAPAGAPEAAPAGAPEAVETSTEEAPAPGELTSSNGCSDTGVGTVDGQKVVHAKTADGNDLAPYGGSGTGEAGGMPTASAPESPFAAYPPSPDAERAAAAPASAPSPATEVAYAEPAATPAPARKPRPAKPVVVPPEARTAWWPARETGKLNLVYAGDASFTKAIALLFDGDFESPASPNQNIQVSDNAGHAVTGQWLVAAGNARMLLFNVQPGVYKIEVGSGLTDQTGRALSTESGGLVYVP